MSTRATLVLLSSWLALGACTDKPASAPASAPTPAPAEAAVPAAPSAVPPAELARQTLEAIDRADMQLVAAVRQRDTRDGKEDFKRFITDPLNRQMFQWTSLPPELSVQWANCISALQTFIDHAEDSFAVGTVAAAPSHLAWSIDRCSKGQ